MGSAIPRIHDPFAKMGDSTDDIPLQDRTPIPDCLFETRRVG